MSIYEKINSGRYINKLKYPTLNRTLPCPNPDCKIPLSNPHVEITKQEFGLPKEFIVLTKFCVKCGRPTEKYLRDEYKEFAEQMTRYREEEGRLADLFRSEALEAAGLSTHPRAGKAFSLAWDRGHSSGLGDVYSNLFDLADLLLKD